MTNLDNKISVLKTELEKYGWSNTKLNQYFEKKRNFSNVFLSKEQSVQELSELLERVKTEHEASIERKKYLQQKVIEARNKRGKK